MRDFTWIALSLCACTEPLPIGGEHHSYVVSRQHLPATSTEALHLGFDLSGDGKVDNAFGSVLRTLASDNLLQSQIRTDGAIDRGDLLQLIDLQRPDDDDRFATGFALQVGANPQPAPCSDPTDGVCRHHLDGSGAFSLAAASSDPQLHCERTDTGFECGPGHLSFQLGILGTPLQVDALGFPPLAIELLAARARFEDVGDGTLRGEIGGAVTSQDLDRLFADYLKIIGGDVQHDCTPDGTPQCGCIQGSSGRFYISALDASHDCSVTFEELKNNSLIVSLFSPDVRIDGTPRLSFGVHFEAVPATIQ